MRKGFSPTFILDKKGDLFAIATGSDATAEHEGGSAPLMTALTGQQALTAKDVGQRLRTKKPRTVLGVPVPFTEQPQAIPDLLVSRRIVADLDNIVFEEGTEAVPGQPAVAIAVLGYSAHRKLQGLLTHRELSFYASDTLDCAGAWDERSFAFKVRGAKNVQKLKRFHAALQAGHGLFAGKFLTSEGKTLLSGVILCDSRALRPEHRTAMAAAQTKFEGECRLWQAARLDELHEKARACLTSSLSLGYLWPVSAQEYAGVPGEAPVVYAWNPGHGVKAAYYGPYSFEALMDWLERKGQGPLPVPLAHKTSMAA